MVEESFAPEFGTYKCSAVKPKFRHATMYSGTRRYRIEIDGTEFATTTTATATFYVPALEDMHLSTGQKPQQPSHVIEEDGPDERRGTRGARSFFRNTTRLEPLFLQVIAVPTSRC